MQTLIKTLTAENGHIFGMLQERRIQLGDCPIKIEIYENTENIPVRGIVGYELKIIHNANTYCGVGEIDHNTIKQISRYEVIGNILRTDGRFERFTFDDISLIEYNLPKGIYIFRVKKYNIISKLLEL